MKKKVILCVDDEPMVLRSLKVELTQSFGNDYLIELAESGEEALEVLDELTQQKVDTPLVISDWLMPHMKGDEFLMKVRQKHPNTATIMLSGQADSQAIERIRSLASGSVMSKPWGKEDLRKTVEKYLPSA